MARIACRWPGGLTLHIKKTGVPPERWPQCRLNGPSGNLMGGVSGDPLRSPQAARQLRQNHLDMLKHMELTKDHQLHEMEHTVHYVENHIPDAFWQEWQAQQEHFMRHVSPHTGATVRHRIVFQLPDPEPVVAPDPEPMRVSRRREPSTPPL